MMWLGMLAAIVGQVPGAPVEPFNALAGLLAAYVAQVADWLAEPDWAQLGVTLPAWPQVAAAYAALGVAMLDRGCAWARRRRELRRASRAGPACAALVAVAGLRRAGVPIAARSRALPAPGLRVVVLDVGQGDSILLHPDDGGPVLVDGGPPGDDLRGQLSDGGRRRPRGRDRHPRPVRPRRRASTSSSAPFPVHRLLYGEPGPISSAPRGPRTCARSGSPRARSRAREACTSRCCGRRGAAPGQGESDPNQSALVLLARWHSFLDAAHRGRGGRGGSPRSGARRRAQGGASWVRRRRPRRAPRPNGARLAVISVGAGNPYGHPTAGTLATLAEHGIPTVRTDQAGDVTIDVSARGWRVESG